MALGLYQEIIRLLTNYVFLSFVISWIIVILIKTFVKAYQRKRFSILAGLETGGIPSSHSTVVASLTTALFLSEGASALFIVCLVFSLIIISDSFTLRKSVGIQGDAINSFLTKSRKKLIKISYGHTFGQVILGILLGIAVSVMLYAII